MRKTGAKTAAELSRKMEKDASAGVQLAVDQCMGSLLGQLRKTFASTSSNTCIYRNGRDRKMGRTVVSDPQVDARKYLNDTLAEDPVLNASLDKQHCPRFLRMAEICPCTARASFS